MRRRLQLALVFAVLAIMSWLLLDIFQLLEYDQLHREYFVGFGRFFYILTYFLLYLFWEGGLRDSPWSPRLAVVSALTGSSIAFTIVLGFFSEEYVGIIQFIGDTIQSLLGTAIFSFGAFYQYKVQSITKELTARLQYVGSLILTLAFVVQLFATPMITGVNEPFWQTISDALVLLGIILFLVFYSINPKLVERIPVQTFEILVYSKSGMNFHSVQVSTKGIESEMDHEQRVVLMSGLSSAVTSFLKTATGTDQELETIQAGNRVMIFSLGSIQISMVAESVTEILLDSLYNLRNEYEKAANSSDPATIKPISDSKFKELIHFNFPYLDVISVSTLG